VEEPDHPKQNKRLPTAGAGATGALATFDTSVSANERRYGDMPMGYHKQVAMRHDYTVHLEAGDGKHTLTIPGSLLCNRRACNNRRTV
jgi:hypothetical protein